MRIYEAECDRCGDKPHPYNAGNLTMFRSALRDLGWQAGKKRVLCPKCRPMPKDPEAAYENWVAGICARSGLSEQEIEESYGAFRMRKRLGLRS